VRSALHSPVRWSLPHEGTRPRKGSPSSPMHRQQSSGWHRTNRIQDSNTLSKRGSTSVGIYRSIKVKIVLQHYAGVSSLYIQEGRQDK